jgi:hypothetical protein
LLLLPVPLMPKGSVARGIRKMRGMRVFSCQRLERARRQQVRYAARKRLKQ